MLERWHVKPFMHYPPMSLCPIQISNAPSHLSTFSPDTLEHVVSYLDIQTLSCTA